MGLEIKEKEFFFRSHYTTSYHRAQELGKAVIVTGFMESEFESMYIP